MSNEAKEYCVQLAEIGKRLDGRGMLHYRDPVIVEYGVSKTAEGSARVTIGKTVVIVGVKLSVETPFPDTPDEGTIMVNAELIGLSNPEFEPGPPTVDAIELSRVVDRGIRESKAIDVKGLSIVPGEKAWTVSIDIVTINDDGNLFDASGLATLAALKDAHFPTYANGKLDYKKKSERRIELRKEPLPATVYKLGNQFIVDPTRREIRSVTARLTVTTSADGTLSALQKGGEMPLTIEEIDRMVSIGIEHGAFLRSKL